MAKRLTWKEYDYTVQIGPGNSWIYRPLINIEISARIGDMNVPLKGLIDSGTDGTLIDASVADKLHIDSSTCKKVKLGGIGSTEGFLSNVELTVPDFSMRMDVPVVFAHKLPMEALLGQRHFFQRFKIRFEKDKNKFYLASL